MSLRYAHLLIPGADFVPEPDQIVTFLTSLVKTGAAPDEAKVRVGKLSGSPRVGMNPVTGEKITIPRRDFVSPQSADAVSAEIAGLKDYEVIMAGTGPVKVQPFVLYTAIDSVEQEFVERFGYEIACRLKSEPVSVSAADFGRPCGSRLRDGVFQRPNGGSEFTVPNAGCARFWIEVRFGKGLYPRMRESLELIHPDLLAKAQEAFRTRFAQGCLWG